MCRGAERADFVSLHINNIHPCPNEIDSRILLEEVDLFLESMGERDIVAVHSGNEWSARKLETSIETLNNSSIGLVPNDADSIVGCRKLFKRCEAFRVSRSVINNEKLEISKRLLENAFNGKSKVLLILVEYRQNNGNERVIVHGVFR